jgi:hypothetical protein
VLADLQIAGEQVNVMALPYAEAATAAHAAAVLAERLREWRPQRAQKDVPSVVSKVGGSVEQKVEAVDGSFVALVAVRYPFGDPENSGAVLRWWLQGLYSRQFAPLALAN